MNRIVLVDTSVWISHFRESNRHLVELLNDGRVICHSLIIGELACGNIQNRSEILALLKSLPPARQVGSDEILYFIESNHLMGKGLGYIDVCLLASAVLTDIPIWTLDNKLNQAASFLKINYKILKR